MTVLSIVYNRSCGTFTLHTKHTSYQMKIGNLNYLYHLYYGPSIGDADLSYQIMQYDRGFSGNPYDSRYERTFSLDAQPQEFSTQQQGDFRIGSIQSVNADGSLAFNGRYVSHRILKGKYSLSTLPTSFATEGDTVDTLEIVLEDAVTKLKVILLYGVFEEADIITRTTKVINGGEGTIRLKKIMSVCMDFLNGSDLDILSLPGRYGQERQVERSRLGHHVTTIQSVRGTSSHQQNPFMVICQSGTTEDHGPCYGFSLMYSGNFLAEAELDQYDQVRVQMGINPHQFEYAVAPGESFEAPEAVLTFTDKGLTGLSHIYHDFYRSNLCHSRFMKDRRPVLINTWEAAFFDFDDEKLVEIAHAAEKMGVELLVMDDGWYGKRDDDNAGLGDWVVNENKIRCGLKELVRRVKAEGLQFGIWFEPEMVSEDSDLYRAHPDWVMEIPGRDAVRSRNQLVLDIARRDVQDYLIEAVNAVLDSADITYLKWDINRSITDLWSSAVKDGCQGETSHRYVMGLYRILNGIVPGHPDVLFEGCSGGGGRYDPAMLAYFPQYWVSDNTKPLDNLKLHFGTSFVYPVSSMGAHVSGASPYVPLETKACVAMCGTFGYELDPTHLDEDFLEKCRLQSDLFRKYYPVIFHGDYYRLSDPFKVGNHTAWESVSKDKKTALISVVITNLTVNGPQEYIHGKGLLPDVRYRVNGGEQVLSGAAIMYAGIPVPREIPDFSALQFYLEALPRD